MKRLHAAVPALLMLCGCAANPLADIALPQLCPRTNAVREVAQMAERIYGVRLSQAVAHFGAPARQSLDEEAALEKLVWGPLAIDYRREDGQTVAMNCEVEMYAGADGAVSRVIWTLQPPETNARSEAPASR